MPPIEDETQPAQPPFAEVFDKLVISPLRAQDRIVEAPTDENPTAGVRLPEYDDEAGREAWVRVRVGEVYWRAPKAE